VTGESIFVRQLMTDGAVLPRARAILLARILCRGDIVAHLLLHGRNVRTGKLPVHMQAVFVATERSMLAFRPTDSTTRATRRHDQTGVTREQRVFIWANAVDAYLTAGRLAGHRPSEHDLWAYLAAARRFGETFGVTGAYTSVQQIEQLASRTMERIAPTSVPAGGWAGLQQVIQADWFRNDSTVDTAAVVAAVTGTTPPPLLAVLRK
jgi:hypothetical protein